MLLLTLNIIEFSYFAQRLFLLTTTLENRLLKIFASALILLTLVKWILACSRGLVADDFEDFFDTSVLTLSAALLCFAVDILSAYLITSRRRLMTIHVVTIVVMVSFLYWFAF